MAQALIRRFLADVVARVDMPGPVVEFGALQVETVQDAHNDHRALFADRDYVGTDFRAGPGVDRVEDLRALTFTDDEVGTAICLDTLEHCEDPPLACRELARVVKPDGGVCVISSVMLFGIHGYPNDYFRFTPEGFRSLLSGFDHVSVAGVGDPEIPFQVIGVGVNGAGAGASLDVASLPSVAAAQAHWAAADGQVRLGPLRYDPADLARQTARELVRLGRERIGRARRG